jgi:hypothetical protein
VVELLPDPVAVVADVIVGGAVVLVTLLGVLDGLMLVVEVVVELLVVDVDAV